MHLLVIRTSAMGDVALVTPVIRGFLNNNPGNRITLVTRKPFTPFFYAMDGVSLFCPDLKQRHKGLRGIYRLYRDISREEPIDAVIDLHDVLRSKILRFFFRLSGIPVFKIDKGRREKKRLIRGIIKTPLRRTVTRYCDVFELAGFKVSPFTGVNIIPQKDLITELSATYPAGEKIEIGVAAFAKHELKKWPEEYMVRLTRMISEKYNVKFWLFGGIEEKEQLEKLCAQIPGSEIVTGTFSLGEELALMSRLRMMIAMDSSNMHMASLVGTKVISIWGGTDPKTGFSPWDQPEEYALKIGTDELSCRPCTVFGKGKCRRGDFACMNWLTPEKVYEKITNLKIL